MPNSVEEKSENKEHPILKEKQMYSWYFRFISKRSMNLV